MGCVLLADDSPQALSWGEKILRAHGMDVVSVSDGAVVLRRIADVKPDVLITDVFLPAKNGFELARHLRGLAEYRHLPIVFAATVSDDFNEQDARNAGADVVLRKPFEASALLPAIDGLIERAVAKRKDSGDATASTSLSRSTVRAAVTLALDRAMPAIIEELTERVMTALGR